MKTETIDRRLGIYLYTIRRIGRRFCIRPVETIHQNNTNYLIYHTSSALLHAGNARQRDNNNNKKKKNRGCCVTLVDTIISIIIFCIYMRIIYFVFSIAPHHVIYIGIQYSIYLPTATPWWWRAYNFIWSALYLRFNTLNIMDIISTHLIAIFLPSANVDVYPYLFSRVFIIIIIIIWIMLHEVHM